MNIAKVGSIVLFLFLMSCGQRRDVTSYLSDIKKTDLGNKYPHINMGFVRGNLFMFKIDTNEVYMFNSNKIKKKNLSWFNVKPNIVIKDTTHFIAIKLDTIANVVNAFKKCGLIGFSQVYNSKLFYSEFDGNDSQFVFIHCQSLQELNRIKLRYDKLSIIYIERDWYYFKMRRRKNS